jgi:hypothetical protein
MSGKDHPSSFPPRVHRRHQAGIDERAGGCRRSRTSAAAGRQAGRQEVSEERGQKREEEEEEEEEGEKKLHETELETLMVGCTWQEKGTPLQLLGFYSLNLRVIPKGPL